MAVAVYVHVPFCPTKCGYCDFNSYAMEGDIVGRTTRAIEREIRMSPFAGEPAKTIFFGGGTPTFLPADDLVGLLRAVMDIHPPVEGCEITSEANPGTVDADKFATMRQGGFNRISLGAQSFLDSDLIALGRVHRSGEIERAVRLAREAGFDNLNVDLMFALPGQSMRAWNANLERALALEPDHISLYCLTIEPNTAFYKLHLKGQLDLPDDETQVAMYDRCVEETARRGFRQYEISNFSLPGRECQHNLCYWRHEPYAGYGPGAVGAMPTPVGMRRATNVKHPERYCDAVERGLDLACEQELLSEATQRTERIMLGLRLNDGFAISESELDPIGLGRVRERGWVRFIDGHLQLTPQGRHFCSEVALELT